MTKPFAFIHIIESPSAEDILDGRTEGRALSEILELIGIPYCYNLVTNWETLISAITDRLYEAAEIHDLAPIIHLSMHGNSKEVFLTDETTIGWTDLRELLAPLTNEMDGELLICMSSCFGSAASQMAKRVGGADKPFWALVGNDGEVDWGDAAVAYVTFYHLLFKDVPIDECVESMKKASHDERFRVQYGQDIKDEYTKHIRALCKKYSLTELLKKTEQEVGQRSRVISARR